MGGNGFAQKFTSVMTRMLLGALHLFVTQVPTETDVNGDG